MGNHMYLMDEFMCMAHMIFTMVMYFVWGITFAGLHQWMIWVTGARLCARLTGYNIDIRPESGYYGEEEPKAAEAEKTEDTAAE